MEKKAGIVSFEKFGYINAVNSLANGNVSEWEKILNLPYEIFFLKQCLNKTEAEYIKKFNELSKPK